MMTYLGIIEERVNELLEVYTRIQAAKAGSLNPMDQDGVHLRMVQMNRDLDFASAAAAPTAPSFKDIKEDRKDIRIEAPSIGEWCVRVQKTIRMKRKTRWRSVL